jgi:hypothetical protein
VYREAFIAKRCGDCVHDRGLVIYHEDPWAGVRIHCDHLLDQYLSTLGFSLDVKWLSVLCEICAYSCTWRRATSAGAIRSEQGVNVQRVAAAKA